MKHSLTRVIKMVDPRAHALLRSGSYSDQTVDLELELDTRGKDENCLPATYTKKVFLRLVCSRQHST